MVAAYKKHLRIREIENVEAFLDEQSGEIGIFKGKTVVESVEDAQIQILKTFKMIQEYKEENPDVKFLCILDSLGALVAEKVLRDADKDKVASENANNQNFCTECGNQLLNQPVNNITNKILCSIILYMLFYIKKTKNINEKIPTSTDKKESKTTYHSGSFLNEKPKSIFKIL